MRGAGEHELKATLVSLAPARTCSSTGQLQRSSIWNLRHRPRLLLASPARLCNRPSTTREPSHSTKGQRNSLSNIGGRGRSPQADPVNGHALAVSCQVPNTGSQSAWCCGGRPDAPASSTRRRCSACRATRKASMASSTRSHSASRLAPKARSSSHTGRCSLPNFLT